MEEISLDVVVVGDVITGYVEIIVVFGVLWGIEDVAADEGGVGVVGIGFAFFVGTVEGSM